MYHSQKSYIDALGVEQIIISIVLLCIVTTFLCCDDATVVKFSTHPLAKIL